MGKRRQQRQSFTPAFHAEAVKVMRQRGKSVAMVARALDLRETPLRCGVQQADAEAGRGRDGALTTDERTERVPLRREVRTLRMDRDILNKATAFFAKEQG